MNRPRRLLREVIYHVTCPCGNEFTESFYDIEEDPDSLECPSCGEELAMPEYMGEYE